MKMFYKELIKVVTGYFAGLPIIIWCKDLNPLLFGFIQMIFYTFYYTLLSKIMCDKNEVRKN